MSVVDTNVLVYAANTSCAEHRDCRHLLETLRAGSEPWFLSWNIAYEFLRVVTHPNVLESPWQTPGAWNFLKSLFASRSLSMLRHGERHIDAFETLARTQKGLRGNLLFDAHTVALMREHGIFTIYTRDSDFHRFEGITVVDPIENAG